jgi:hypothetical protein
MNAGEKPLRSRISLVFPECYPQKNNTVCFSNMLFKGYSYRGPGARRFRDGTVYLNKILSILSGISEMSCSSGAMKISFGNLRF